jgi:hypothetical protein
MLFAKFLFAIHVVIYVVEVHLSRRQRQQNLLTIGVVQNNDVIRIE